MEENGGNVGAAWSGSGGGEFVIEENKKANKTTSEHENIAHGFVAYRKTVAQIDFVRN